MRNKVLTTGRWQLGRFLRDTRGATALEFGLVGLPFLFTLFAVLEVGLIFFASSALETGTQEAARTIRTRSLQLGGGGVSEFRQLVCDNGGGLIQCGDKLFVDVNTYPSFTDANITPPVNAQGQPVPGAFNPGAATQVMVVKVYYVWNVYTPGLGLLLGNIGSTNARLLLSTAAFRNE